MRKERQIKFQTLQWKADGRFEELVTGLVAEEGEQFRRVIVPTNCSASLLGR